MKDIRTKRLLLRPFRESDYDDLFEFLSQLKDDEFEGYPGITYENGREHLQQRMGSEEFYAVELPDSGKVHTGFLRNVARGILLHGSFWRRLACSARHISGRTSGSIRIKTECPSGRTLMCMQG